MANPRHTAAKRHGVFERLAWNGGNVVRTARDTGVPRQTISDWIEKYADEYAAVVDETRAKLLSQVVEDRKLALNVLRDCLEAKREQLKDPRGRANVRVSDIARALEILDKIARCEGTENGDGGPPAAGADECKASVRVEIEAILGEADQKPKKRVVPVRR